MKTYNSKHFNTKLVDKITNALLKRQVEDWRNFMNDLCLDGSTILKLLNVLILHFELLLL